MLLAAWAGRYSLSLADLVRCTLNIVRSGWNRSRRRALCAGPSGLDSMLRPGCQPWVKTSVTRNTWVSQSLDLK